MTQTLNLATEADKAEILALYHSHIGAPGVMWSEHYPTIENIEKDLSNRTLWCLRIDGELAGAVSIGDPGDVGEVGWVPQNPAELARLAIAPHFQGQRLASVLIEHALVAARDNGFDGVVLLVSPEAKAAQHLYEKHGFEPCGEVFGWNFLWLKYQQSF